jgi:hypothetical protein
VNEDVFHEGEWRLLDIGPAGDGSWDQLLAWSWRRGGDVRIVVVNAGHAPAQGVVRMGCAAGQEIVLLDRLDGRRYYRTRDDLRSGLYVRLETGRAHVFEVI